MDIVKDMPGWVALLLTLVSFAIGGTAWISNAIAKAKNDARDDDIKIREEIVKTRHDIRSEIGKFSLQLEQDDLESEKRTNRQIDDLKVQIARLQTRLDEYRHVDGRGD